MCLIVCSCGVNHIKKFLTINLKIMEILVVNPLNGSQVREFILKQSYPVTEARFKIRVTVLKYLNGFAIVLCIK